ncbi:MAG: HNH endonuclease [Acidimicrobiales bacterium]
MSGPPVTVLLHVDDQVLSEPSAEVCAHAEGVGAVTSHTARRLACSSAVERLFFRPDGSVEPGGRSRSVPRRLRRAVVTRDGGCRFPGCTQRVYVDVHHVVFFSEGGRTVPSNLVCLCRHHHRLVHEGGFRLEMDGAFGVRAWMPDGREVSQAPAPARPLDLDLSAEQKRGGLDVGPETLNYCGESFDLGLAVDCILQAAGKLY